jgi:hypothetical protein
MKLRYSIFSLYTISALILSCSTHVKINEQVIELPVGVLNTSIDELSYVMGIGDLDGDKETDYVIRVWSEEQNLKNDIETRSFAYTHDGTFLWELNHHIVPMGFGEPCAMAALTIWDFNGDGRDEVVTTVWEDNQYKLVMLDGLKGPQNVLHTAALPEVSYNIFSALAYVDGKNPYVAIETGRDSKIILYDRDLNRKAIFDDPKYYRIKDTVWLLPYDFDKDDNDELVYGPLLLNEDLSIYLNATQFGFPDSGEIRTERSWVADIDPDNPGYEWFLEVAGKNRPYYVEPDYYKGPYLLDVDKRKIIWHENINKQGMGWGRLHRGWVHDVDPKMSGLELFCTGYYWEDDEWKDALEGRYRMVNGSNIITAGGAWVDGYWETYKLYSASGKELVARHGTRVGYPVMWDDDTEPEYFRYRNGELLDNFLSDDVIAQLAKHNGSGECTIADIQGDWREEIIITDNQGIVHIYANGEPTKFPNRPSPKTGHNYLLHLASIGNGLPKPVPPDSEWFENLP